MMDNFAYFSVKPYVVAPHLNSLNEMFLFRGHNINETVQLRVTTFDRDGSVEGHNI